jgi:HPt (histidine-containing phosphotransfer) domain-containing protein
MSTTPPPPGRSASGAQDDAAIDLAGGVQRVMGDHGIFARVLERFRGDYRRAAASIRAALAAGDTSLAQRLTHTLKGASGMIEARPLQRQALALEQALHDQPGGWEQQLDRLDAELDRVLRELDTMLAPQAARTARAQAAAPGGAQALVRLAALLDTGDGAALDLVEDEHAALAAALGEARWREVEAAVNDFDFERALALLDGPPNGP